MKKILVALLVLALVAPSFAVTISGSDLGSGKMQLTYNVPAGEVLRGVALKLSTTAGTATIAGTGDVTAIATGFNTFIDYAFSTPSGYTVGAGHPLADPAAAGVLTVFPASTFVLSMGALDQAGAQAGVTGSGVLCEIQYMPLTADATIHVEADTLRGGAVVGDAVTQPIAFDVVLGGVPPVETLTAPAAPTGNATAFITVSQTYTTTGGSVSSYGHAVQYRFNFGDGTFSTWGTALTAAKIWTVGGVKSITVEARCAADTAITAVSAPLAVTIQECQFYNLTKKITTFAPTGTDNAVNATDVQKIVTYINTYKVSSTSWLVPATNPNYMAGFNLSTSASAINATDVQAIITYINNNKISTSSWLVNCGAKP